MGLNLNARLSEQCKIVTGLAPITPSTSTPDYVSLKGYERLTIIITVDNGNTVTGSAIALKQATAVAGTGEDVLAFSKAWRNIDTDAGDMLTEFTVSSDTFTTDSTNAKNLMYVIEVKAEDLNVAGGYDCVRLATGNGANMVLSAVYILSGAKFPTSTTASSAIVD